MKNQLNITGPPFFVRIRRLAHSVLGFFDAYLNLRRPIVTVYCYHSIASDAWRFSVRMQDLAAQLRYLLSKAQPISPDDLLSFIKGDLKLCSPRFLITFDDGYKDILGTVDLFRRNNIKPLLFVISRPNEANRFELDNEKALLDDEDIMMLREAGWSIGCHSATHANFSLLDEAGLDREVKSAKTNIEMVTGTSVKCFAYPRGKYNQAVISKVRAAGYDLAFTVDHGIVDQSTDQYRIPRVGVDGTHGLREFQVMGSVISIRLKQFGMKVVGKFL